MAVQQDIILNFKANLDAAKQDLTALATLYQQSLKPQGEPGALDAAQKGQVEQVISERAAAKGIPEEEVKKILQEVIVLEDQYKLKKEEAVKIAERQILLGEREVEATQKKNEALGNAAELLGLQKNASVDVIKAKLEELKANQQVNMTEQERLALIQKVEAELRTASTQSGRITKTLNEQTSLHNQQIGLNNEMNDIYGRIREQLTKIAKTEEERDLIEQGLLPHLLQQHQQLQINTKEREKTAAAADKEKKETEAINAALKRAPDTFAKKAVSAVLYYEALNALKRVARAAINTLKDLDAALTDIAVVTDMTREESWALLGTYQEMAKEVGLTASEVAKLSIEFFRQGREARDALELTKTAAQFAKIAAIDVKEAANFLTAAINGFNLAASDATMIIDKFAALGAGAAASAQEIAIALSKVAPAAASAGVEVDTLMAFVTKGIETTREAPENIGTAFKTVFARMRQLTDLGKTIEDGLDVNKVDNALKNIGVELRNANGEFRDLDDVLIEVGGRWDSITRNQQAYVATTLAGTRQQTRLIALFEDFDRTLELVELSQKSAGAAAIQHEEYLQGMAAATTRLQSSFQELVTSFVQSDAIIGIINGLNTGIELLNTSAGRLIITFAALRVVMAAVQNRSGRLGRIIYGENGTGGLITGFNKYRRSIIDLIIEKKRLAATNALTGKTLGPLQTKFAKLGLVMEGVKNKSISSGDAFKIIGSSGLKTASTGLAKIKGAFVAFGKFLLSPLGIIMILAGVVLAIKKIRDSGDTTNIRIARLKVVFDRWARTLEKIGKVIIDKVLPALKFLTNFIPGLALLNHMLKLSVTEEAAAGLRVLVNETKNLNKELRESESRADKLKKAIETYVSLSNVGFKTAGQISQMEEAETVLQDILGVSATGGDLIAQARSEFARQQEAIEENYDLLNNKVRKYFEDNPLVSFQEALLDPSFDDELRAALPALAVTYGQELIQGFDNMTPEVQAAISRMINLDPASFLDATQEIMQATEDFKTTVKVGSNYFAFEVRGGESLEEAFARAGEQYTNFNMTFEEFAARVEDGFELVATEVPNLYAQIAPKVATALDDVLSATNAVEFADALRDLQGDIDLSDFSNEQRSLLFRTFPNLETLLDLPNAAGQFESLFERGGVSFIRNFNPVREEVMSLADDLQKAYASPFSRQGDGERLAGRISDELFEILNSGDLLTSATQAINAVFRGAVGGVVIPEEERVRVANSILSMIPSIDTDVLRTSVFGFADDFASISELAGKSITEFTQKDLELLAKYPGVLQDIQSGQFDINAFKEKENEIILQNIEDQKEAAIVNDNAAMRAIQLQYDLGQLTREQRDAAMADQEDLFRAQMTELGVLEEILSTQSDITEESKDRYKAQLDALNAQKESINKAKEMRELQQQSADIARKSLEATRIGATGTIEAQFNQQQLNQEIAAMNRQLQDQMMLAQIEAQQKILEDSQQKAIQEATQANTSATVDNTEAVNNLAEAMATGIDPTLTTNMRSAVTGVIRQPFDLNATLALAE